ncbi:hypothetical protein [Candidatus Entotheonella palauensis]|uniref:hypothetical protein n=1 Tax=Candidatus Entotheonella palauensis TaxID=93172 RepID=UPI000B7E852C|nr:hypothetical protein [Candidatus Entotheonella palauensis]
MYERSGLLFRRAQCGQRQLTTRLLELPVRSQAKTGQSKVRRLQEIFVEHLSRYRPGLSGGTHREVVITIDNALWHGDALIAQVLEAHPHLCLKRLLCYSPQLNVIERFCQVLRCRATHNRLFTSMALLRAMLRHNICYF